MADLVAIDLFTPKTASGVTLIHGAARIAALTDLVDFHERDADGAGRRSDDGGIRAGF